MDSKSASVPLQDSIRSLLLEGDETRLSALLNQTDSIDLALALYDFTRAEQVSLLTALPEEKAAEVFCSLDAPTMDALLEQLDLGYLATLLRFIEPDDAADVVGMMGQQRSEALLNMLSPRHRGRIDLLLAYDEDSAGGLMDPDVVRVQEDQTVAEAVEAVRRYVAHVELDEFFSLFVVDESGSLVGTVPNWKMLLAHPEEKISQLMNSTVISVEATVDQEEISRLARDHDLVSVPVVDAENRLIGRITHDDIVDVIDEEHEEDMGRISGTGGEEVRELSLWHTIRQRFPWLLIALVGEFLLALFMQNTESFLLAVPQLAFFFPLIMAMGGTTGVQSSSLVIRGLATGEMDVSHLRRRLARESLVALAIGSLFAIVLLAAGTGMTGNLRLATAVGLAIMVGILFAAIAGTAIPVLLKRMGFDPALATGPFITTLNDIIGILVYLGIAYAILI